MPVQGFLVSCLHDGTECYEGVKLLIQIRWQRKLRFIYKIVPSTATQEILRLWNPHYSPWTGKKLLQDTDFLVNCYPLDGHQERQISETSALKTKITYYLS